MIAYIIAFILLSIYFYFKYKEVKTEYKHVALCYVFTFFLIFIFIEIVGFPSLKEFYQLRKRTGHWYQGNSNFLLFKEGLSVTEFLNTALFVPVGIFLPLMWKKYTRFVPTLFYGAILSMLIEFSQLFTFTRVTDINDVVMNTLGTFIGWLIFKELISRFLPQKDMKENEALVEAKYEEWLLPSVAIISVLFV
jgi:glycopeptide antibiotics resistance protein